MVQHISWLRLSIAWHAQWVINWSKPFRFQRWIVVGRKITLLTCLCVLECNVIKLLINLIRMRMVLNN